MTHTSDATSPTRSALFIDFDNVYTGLSKLEADAAELFATDPARWLGWIERGPQQGGENKRSLLVRRCYLNPRAFSKYRNNFTGAAFNVVDCPTLTQQGKNSTDIHMVMDILDTFGHPTRFDEFIIFSGDSDFTPVLLRLRAHDRRTLIMTAGAAAKAYKAASDLVITGPHFVYEGLGKLRRPAASPGYLGALLPATVQTPEAVNKDAAGQTVIPESEAGDEVRMDELAVSITACAKRHILSSDQPLAIASLAQKMIDELGRIVVETKWAGAGGFKNLLKKNNYLGWRLFSLPSGAAYLYDPRRHEPPVAAGTSAGFPNPPALAGDGHPEPSRLCA